MYECEICGRKINKKNYLGGYVLCSKHMRQLHSHGKFLDTCPRTQNDLNDYQIEGEITYGGLYDGITSEQIDEFIIDTEDLSKVKYHKWRFSHSHIVTGLPAQKTQRELSWVIMDFDNRNNPNIVIEHINGNPKDNRKSNLRICEQKENILNKSFMSNNTLGFIGVSYRKDRNRYDPEIRLNSVRCHLGYTKTLPEAVYKRAYAESILFKDFSNKEEYKKKIEFCNTLSQDEKKKLEDIVISKLKEKNLWQ